MHQLSGLDAVFLSMETPTTHSHIGGLTVLAPPEDHLFDFEAFRQVVGERLAFCPRFTWRVQEVPLGLDLPYWVDDPHFDLSYHVRRIAVPSPGGLNELMALAGYLHSQPLDRSRPLWEAWLVEGLADGRNALYIKTHHCLMDGVSGVGLAELLCDLAPEPALKPIFPVDGGPEGEQPGPRVGRLEMAVRGVANASKRPTALARHAARIGASFLASLREPDVLPAVAAPRTSLNGAVGRGRAIATTHVPLDAVKALRKHFDVTVNDVVLALTGGALRRYLQAREELPEQSLVAMVPVSTRAAGDDAVGNQISQINVSWASDVEEAGERLLKISASAQRAKANGQRSGANLMVALGESLPPALVRLVSHAGHLAADAAPLPGNAVVSSVRATPVPLYIAGARVERLVPMSLLAPGQGLNFTAVSYCDDIHFGILVDPQQVPQPWLLADGIQEALAELQAAADERIRQAS